MTDPIQRTVDEQQWHRRKVGASGPDYSEEGADRDAIPSKRGHALRGADKCGCGGTPLYFEPTTRYLDPVPAQIRCGDWQCGLTLPIHDGQTLAVSIAIWNTRAKQAQCVHSWMRQDDSSCRSRFRCCHCGREL